MLEAKKRTGTVTTTYAGRHRSKSGDLQLNDQRNPPSSASSSSLSSSGGVEESLTTCDRPLGSARELEPITQNNFVRKVLEVLKPTTPRQPSLLENTTDEGEESVEEKRHCVRNVHELLESGSANRLYEEVDYIVTGLEALPRKGRLRERLAYYGELLRLLLGGRLLTRMEMSTLRTTGIISRLAAFVSSLEDIPDEDLKLANRVGSHKFIVLLANALYGGHQYGKEDMAVMTGLAVRIAANLLTSNDLVDQVVTEEWRQRLSSDSYAELAIWLLHRTIVSWQMRRPGGDNKPGLEEEPKALRVIIHECGRMAKLSECVNLRMCILGILLYLFESGEEYREAVRTVCISYFASARNPLDGQHPTCLLTALTLLVAITGPDEGAKQVCACPVILQLVKHLFISSSPGSSEVDTLIAAIITNVTDRHPSSRHIYRDDEEFMELLVARVLYPDDSSTRLYQGMLLGILLFDDEKTRMMYAARHQNLLSCIGQCFRGLIEHLSAAGVLKPAMQAQLAAFSQPYITDDVRAS